MHMTGLVRASMNPTFWGALRLQSSLQSALSLLYTPVEKLEPLVFNSCIIFCTNWDAIFRMPGRDELVSLSQSNTLIRNTLLAITACHLRHMSPGILQHRIAEHFYQSHAIQDFQIALDIPSKSLGQQGVNALLPCRRVSDLS